MTEQEWLTCQEPAKLLDFCKDRLTEGQLHAWRAACLEQAYKSPGFSPELHPGALYPELESGTWYWGVQAWPWETPAVMADRVRLLRCVAGPFLPVIPEGKLSDWGKAGYTPPEWTVFRDEWRTPAALAIARRIRDGEERDCPGCGGRGMSGEHGNRGVGTRENPITGVCLQCHGKGTVHVHPWEDMPVLADAMEEAGCPVGIGVLEHLRGLERCACKKRSGRRYKLVPRVSDCEGGYWTTCRDCQDGWLPGPLPALHCAGACWVLNLVLGDQ